MVFPSLVPSLGVSRRGLEGARRASGATTAWCSAAPTPARTSTSCATPTTRRCVLGEMVRDRGLFTLEEAVHKMTDVPGRLYGLRDRGRVAEGCTPTSWCSTPTRIGSGPARGAPRPARRRRAALRRGGRASSTCSSTGARSSPVACSPATSPARCCGRASTPRPSPFPGRNRRGGSRCLRSRGVAFVTGASRGIGKAIARVTSPRPGYDVAITARTRAGGRGARALVDAEGVRHDAAARQPARTRRRSSRPRARRR